MKDSPNTSDLSLTKKVWKGIWSLRIPNRVKTLMRRAGSDALPTRVNLRKRRLLIDDSVLTATSTKKPPSMPCGLVQV